MEPPSLRRGAHGRIMDALGSSRVVLIHGPRQSGKTTLAAMVHRERGGRFVTFDDDAVRAAALEDPQGFIEGAEPLIIDEFQRAGDPLLRAIKVAVDRSNRPGRFLLTGSTNFLTVPNLSESLAGRVDIIDLWPLSQGEIGGREESFPDRLMGPTEDLRATEAEPLSRAALFGRVVRGGFPEAVGREGKARGAWFESYVRTVLDRDFGEIARIHRPDHLPALLRMLAARTATDLNTAGIAKDLGAVRTTVAGHIRVLGTVFLFHTLPAWFANFVQRAVKSPKIHVTDTGVASHLMGQGVPSLLDPLSRASGPLLETFVAGEVARQRTWSAAPFDLYHLRDRVGREIDLVLEARDGRIAAVEVKAAKSVSPGDFRHLEWLRNRLGGRFANGVVLHAGERVLSFGDRMTAMPVSALWAATPATCPPPSPSPAPPPPPAPPLRGTSTP